MDFQKIKILLSTTITALFVFALGVFIAYSGWLPFGTPPGGNVSKPIHTGGNQIKAGKLILNKSEEANFGLIVASGFVSIGDIWPVRDKLNLGGNLNITGLILPQGKSGRQEDILTKTADKEIKWKNRKAWITVITAPAKCGFPIIPRDCHEFGYKEYTNRCLTDRAINSRWGLAVRVCYRDLSL